MPLAYDYEEHRQYATGLTLTDFGSLLTNQDSRLELYLQDYFHLLAPEIKAQPQLAKLACQLKPSNLAYLPTQLRYQKQYYLSALKADLEVLKYCPWSVRNNLELAKLVIQQRPDLYCQLGEEVRDHYPLALKAVAARPANLEYVSVRLRAKARLAKLAFSKLRQANPQDHHPAKQLLSCLSLRLLTNKQLVCGWLRTWGKLIKRLSRLIVPTLDCYQAAIESWPLAVLRLPELAEEDESWLAEGTYRFKVKALITRAVDLVDQEDLSYLLARLPIHWFRGDEAKFNLPLARLLVGSQHYDYLRFFSLETIVKLMPLIPVDERGCFITKARLDRPSRVSCLVHWPNQYLKLIKEEPNLATAVDLVAVWPDLSKLTSWSDLTANLDRWVVKQARSLLAQD